MGILLKLIVASALLAPSEFKIAGELGSDNIFGYTKIEKWPKSGWEFWVDDFVSTGKMYGSIYTRNNTRVGAGGANLVTTMIGGWIRLTTGNNAADMENSTPQYATFDTGLNYIMEVKAYLDSDLADKHVRFGFSDAPFGAETQYVYFCFDYSNDNTNWWHCSDNGTNASLGIGPTADTTQTLTIKVAKTSGTATFFVDGTLMATVANAVGGGTNMYLYFGIETEGASSEAVYIDRISTAWSDE